ncbi:hypothetical protein [Streptosporangium sp. G12]
MIIDPLDVPPPVPPCICVGPVMVYAGRRPDGLVMLRTVHAPYCESPNQMEAVQPEPCASCSGSGPLHDRECPHFIDLSNNPIGSAT